MMEQRTCAACGKAAGDANLCKECVKDWAKRLAWLLKAGMPALQQIAYKQATTRERSPRHGNRAYAAPPVNEAAQALYSAVETHLQLTGGMLGVKPIGHDRYDRPRTSCNGPTSPACCCTTCPTSHDSTRPATYTPT